MKFKMKLKMGIDFLMTVLLLLLMAYQVTGEAFHEYIGAGMLILFLIHNFLNFRWYNELIKGRYTVLRVIRTAVNFLCLAAMLIQAYSGIVLSRYLFAALPINGGMATARVLHLAGSYWSFVLMSIHLGLHWNMILGMFYQKSNGKTSAVLVWILRLLAVEIAVYGAISFYKANIISYLFLKMEFAFMDYEKSGAMILIEYFAMMSFLVFLSYYGSKVLGKISQPKRREKKAWSRKKNYFQTKP